MKAQRPALRIPRSVGFDCCPVEVRVKLGAMRNFWGLSARVLSLLLPLAACAGATVACSGDKAPPRGQLIVAFQTDLSIPKDVQTIVISIYAGGSKVYHQRFPLAPNGKFNLPGTLAIVAGEKKNQPITVRVVGLDQADKAQVIRQAVSTVPTDRLALLHLPLQFLCIQKVDQGVDIDGTEEYNDSCTGKEQSCIAGDCKPDEIDLTTLPNYAGDLVFGGVAGPGLAGGQCVDVLSCFAGASSVVPDMSNCSIPLPSGGGDLPEGPGGPGGGAPPSDTTSTHAGEVGFNFNIGLSLPPGGAGICDSARCIVALDNDALIGWRAENGRAMLPPAVCARLGTSIDDILVTESCVTKKTAFPTCGPWSNVTGGNAPQSDAGSSGESSVVDDPCRSAEPGLYCEWEIQSGGGETIVDCGPDGLVSSVPCNPGDSCINDGEPQCTTGGTQLPDSGGFAGAPAFDSGAGGASADASGIGAFAGQGGAN